MSDNKNEEVLLSVENLKTSFQTLRGKITAVDGVSFQVHKGEILGVVGESGCGKSVTSQSIMRLYDEKELASYEGKILFQGENILEKSSKEMEKIRGEGISMVFQDALSSLNPLFTVGSQIVEMLRVHKNISKKEAWETAENMLRLTGIPAPEERVHNYPHEMSGGMRQRAMIAMALSCEPKLLIADEPTTALDVTIQAQTCDRVIIMYLGHIVEEGTVEDIFDRPLHPYTVGLIKSIPTMDTKKDDKLFMIKGTVPPLSEVQEGCRFCNRCEYATDICKKQDPELMTVNETQKVRCHLINKEKAVK